MNILFVNNIPFNPSYGGIEQVTEVLTKSLLAKGHNVFYLCGSIEIEQKEILDYDYPVELFVMPKTGFLNSKENLSFYRSLVDELHIEVIINQRGLDVWQNELLLYGPKKISVLHSTPNRDLFFSLLLILNTPSSFWDYIKYPFKIMLYPFLRYRVERVVRRSISSQYKFIAEHSDAVVLLSNSDKNVFLSYLDDVFPKKLVGIPNPNTYQGQLMLDLEGKEKLILYVGRLSKNDKRPIYLLKIWKKIFKSFSDWQLIFVGDGPDSDAMHDYIKKHKLKHVSLVGKKNNVEEYYKKASIVCLTSVFEGWGMALTEGMQFGCIPLTFNNYGAALDIIDDGVNGFLVPAYNLNFYTDRLIELMLDERKRKKMAKAAFEKSKEFDVENIVDKWEDLLYSIE